MSVATIEKPRMLSLCSGIGGIDLAAEWTGFQIAGQVELDPFCRAILAQHWPYVPRPIHDIKDVQGDEDAYGKLDLIAGGIPCQPFSDAGKRRGTADDRHLWPEMLRIVRRAQPTWVLIENVTGFIDLALDLMLADLEAQGYESRTYVFPSAAIGAPHRRMRIFVVAHTAGGRRQAYPSTLSIHEVEDHPHCLSAASDGPRGGLPESRMGRMLHGISARLDAHRWPSGPGEAISAWEPQALIPEQVPQLRQRIKALGNAVVPQQVYPILAGIAFIQQQQQQSSLPVAAVAA